MTNDGYIGWDNYVKEQSGGAQNHNPACLYPIEKCICWTEDDWEKYDMNYALEGSVKSLEKKVKDLEEWKRVHIEWFDAEQLSKKVKDLENWHKQEQINAETNSKLAAAWIGDIRDCKDKVKDLESKTHSHYEILARLEKLEEWKQSHIVIPSNHDVKLIDKKVWEEIKTIVAHSTYHNERHRSNLVDAIKKVDPSYEQQT